MVLISASILAADCMKLGEEIRAVDKAGVDCIHFDVMDGQFVPNITMGADFVKGSLKITSKILDVHLMIEKPENFVEKFADAGAHSITVHYESCVHLQRILSAIKARGVKAGVSLNPSTPESVLRYVIADVDSVLVMSVNPGFAGQKFLTSQLDKISNIRAMLKEANNHNALVAVDGGVDVVTAPQVVKAGAQLMVVGSALFGSKDYAATIQTLRSAR